MAVITEIGIVKSTFKEPADPFEMRKAESSIEVYEQFAEGLYDIESNRYLHIIFHFDRSESYKLRGQWYYGGEKGVFACRSPKRPGAIGLTTVELLSRQGNVLRVKGLDALDNTPVLDIKPVITEIDHHGDADAVALDFVKQNPRASLIPLLKGRDMQALLLESGKLHGHYCPGLALGVAATVYGLHALAEYRGVSVASLEASDGMEELLGIIEINSCFVDGVQFVSGCTLGNNSLIYKDLGKTAVSFCQRSGNGVRVAVRENISDTIARIDPGFYPLFKESVEEHSRDPETLKAFKQAARNVSFRLVDFPSSELFSITKREVDLPDYAPIEPSVVCASCGESVMGGKLASNNANGAHGRMLCKTCANEAYDMLDGSGIHRR
jgi:formylmethanofuran dehydrogenase subunit E